MFISRGSNPFYPVKNSFLKPALELCQAAEPFIRELFFADESKPLPDIAPDPNTPPVVLLPGAMSGGPMNQPPPAMGGPGFPMMGGGMAMGPMGPMGPPAQMGGVVEFPGQMPMPPGRSLFVCLSMSNYSRW